MLSMPDRLLLVTNAVWTQLPPLKRLAADTTVRFADLGAVHGQYSPTTDAITLNPQLCCGDLPQLLPLIDSLGNDPPASVPCVSRVLHTLLHEVMHAILFHAALDDDPAWLALSGWVEAPDDPVGTARYTERRPGWVQGASAWRYRSGRTFFPRPYSARSPYEDAADCCTYLALGWEHRFTTANAHAKQRWLRRAVWEETGMRAFQAAAHRWRVRQGRAYDESDNVS